MIISVLSAAAVAFTVFLAGQLKVPTIESDSQERNIEAQYLVVEIFLHHKKSKKEAPFKLFVDSKSSLPFVTLYKKILQLREQRNRNHAIVLYHGRENMRRPSLNCLFNSVTFPGVDVSHSSCQKCIIAQPIKTFKTVELQYCKYNYYLNLISWCHNQIISILDQSSSKSYLRVNESLPSSTNHHRVIHFWQYWAIYAFFFITGMLFPSILAYMANKYRDWIVTRTRKAVDEYESAIVSYLQNCDHTNAQSLISKALAYISTRLGNDHTDFAAFNHLQAKAYILAENFKSAEEILLFVREKYSLYTDEFTAKVLEDLAYVITMQGKHRYDEAYSLLQQALEMYECALQQRLADELIDDVDGSAEAKYRANLLNSIQRRATNMLQYQHLSKSLVNSKYVDYFRRELRKFYKQQNQVHGSNIKGRISESSCGSNSDRVSTTSFKNSEAVLSTIPVCLGGSLSDNESPSVAHCLQTADTSASLSEASSCRPSNKSNDAKLNSAAARKQDPSSISYGFSYKSSGSSGGIIPESTTGIFVNGIAEENLPFYKSADIARIHTQMGQMLIDNYQFIEALQVFVVAFKIYDNICGADSEERTKVLTYVLFLRTTLQHMTAGPERTSTVPVTARSESDEHNGKYSNMPHQQQSHKSERHLQASEYTPAAAKYSTSVAGSLRQSASPDSITTPCDHFASDI